MQEAARNISGVHERWKKIKLKPKKKETTVDPAVAAEMAMEKEL